MDLNESEVKIEVKQVEERSPPHKEGKNELYVHIVKLGTNGKEDVVIKSVILKKGEIDLSIELRKLTSSCRESLLWRDATTTFEIESGNFQYIWTKWILLDHVSVFIHHKTTPDSLRIPINDVSVTKMLPDTENFSTTLDHGVPAVHNFSTNGLNNPLIASNFYDAIWNRKTFTRGLSMSSAESTNPYAFQRDVIEVLWDKEQFIKDSFQSLNDAGGSAEIGETLSSARWQTFFKCESSFSGLGEPMIDASMAIGAGATFQGEIIQSNKTYNSVKKYALSKAVVRTHRTKSNLS
jgi:hypothetical protein